MSEPTPPPAPPAHESKLQELQTEAQRVLARLGHVQMQIDALLKEKDAALDALKKGEEAYNAIKALFASAPAQSAPAPVAPPPAEPGA